MGMVDERTLEEVRRANDIVGLVQAYVPLKRSGARLVGLCPFHNEKSPSFSVNPAMQIFKCFGCGAGGDAFKFVMLKEGMTFPDAIRHLADRAGISLPDKDKAEPRRPGDPTRNDLWRINEWAADWYHRRLRTAPDAGHARDYLIKRGVTGESLERFRLGHAPDAWDGLIREAQRVRQLDGTPLSPAFLLAAGLIKARTNGGGFYDVFRNRVMFPITDTLQRVTAFGGRTLGDDPAKYVNSPETMLFSKGRGLYGLDTGRNAIQKSRRAVVVEGYMDCLMPQQAGVGEVVATLGTALTPDQVRLLKRYADTVVLVFDSDTAGERAADRALEIFLAEQTDVRVARVPAGKDPADYVLAEGGDAFRAVVEAARPAMEYKFDLIRRRLQTADTLEGRRRAAEELLATLATVAGGDGGDALRTGMILADLAKMTDLDVAELRTRLTLIRNRQRPPRPPARPAPDEAPPSPARDRSHPAPPDDDGPTDRATRRSAPVSDRNGRTGPSAPVGPADFDDGPAPAHIDADIVDGDEQPDEPSPPAEIDRLAGMDDPTAAAALGVSVNRLRAERWVVGLLLRHPEYYAGVREVLDAKMFRHPLAAALAGSLFDALEEAGRVLEEELLRGGEVIDFAPADGGADAGHGDADGDAPASGSGTTGAKGGAPAGESPRLAFDAAAWMSRLIRRPAGDRLLTLAAEMYDWADRSVHNAAAVLEDAIVRIRQEDRRALLADQLPAVDRSLRGAGDQPADANPELLKVAARVGNRTGRNPLARPKVTDPTRHIPPPPEKGRFPRRNREG